MKTLAVRPFRDWAGGFRGPFYIGDDVYVRDEKNPRIKYAAQLLSSTDADGNVVVMRDDTGEHVEVSRLLLSLRGD